MSQQAAMNGVDDEEMSSQGSVNAPVALPRSLTKEQGTTQAPTEQMLFPSLISPAPKMQLSISRMSLAPTATVPIESTAVVAAPMVVIDSPSREETK